MTNAIEDIKTFGMKGQVSLFNSCKEFRKDLARLENYIKAKHFRNYPIKNLAMHDKIVRGTILVRSVPGLGSEYGCWAVDYPILSTSLLDTEKPDWYQKSCGQYRDILLAYHIMEYEDILCMYESDGYTFVRHEPPLSADVIAYYLLINDHLEDEVFIPMYAPSFGVPYEKLGSDNYCEIILNSKVHPNAVILSAENAQHKFEDDYKGARTFCTYYKLPAYSLVDGKLILISEL